MKSVLIHVTVLFLFCLISCVFLFPLPFHLSDGILAAQSGDPLLQIWVIQWNIHKLSTSLTDYFNANIFYPYRNTFAYHDHLFGLGVIGWPIFTLTQNPLLTYNILLLLSFLLSAYGMFLLSWKITGNYAAAFLGGLIFGFLPYRFAHLDHLNLLSIYWLPFCFLFLTRYFFAHERTIRKTFTSLGLFWICYLFQAFTSFNYLFLSALAVVFYIVLILFWQWRIHFCPWKGYIKRDLILFLSGACIVGVLLLPFALPYLRTNRELGFERTIQETVSLSARLQDYWVAPENNMLYGNMTRKWQSPTSPYPREQILFNGLLPIGLSLLALFGMRKNPQDISLNIFRKTYVLLLVAALLLSFGPFINLFGKTVALPYSWLYKYLPGFKAMRVPARFGMLVSFSLAILSALGASQILTYCKKFGKYRKILSCVVTGFLGGIILIEFYSPSPQLSFYPETMETVPKVYQWLARQPEHARIIELPIHSPKDNFEAMYYATFHWKQMINGRSAFIPPGITRVFQEMKSFPSRRSLELLQSLAIRYVVLYTNKFEQPFSAERLPDNAHIIERFSDILLIEIDQSTAASKSEPADIRVDIRLPASLQYDQQYTLGCALTLENQGVYSPLPQEIAHFQLEWKRTDTDTYSEAGEIVLPVLFQPGETVIFPIHFTTPPDPGEYQLLIQFPDEQLRPQAFTKHVTLFPDVPDSRKPQKLQAQFLEVEIPDSWERGKPLPIRLLVRNSGDTLWKAWIEDRERPVGEIRLGVVDWYDASSGEALIQERGLALGARGLLQYDVAPGQEIYITAEIRTPELQEEFILELDMLSEHVRWFSSQNSQTLKKRITLK